MRKSAALASIAIILFGAGAAPSAGAASGTWTWPVAGPVIRAFQPPSSPYGTGHRGIDIAAPVGTVVVAPASGVVTFSGAIGGRHFLSLDHGGGLASTYSWVSALLVGRGDAVSAGEPVARSGSGHPGDTIPNLHFGVKLNGAYVDPMLYLVPPSVSTYIRLAPLLGMSLTYGGIVSAVEPLTPRMARLWDPPSISSSARPCAGLGCASARRFSWPQSWRSREPR